MFSLFSSSEGKKFCFHCFLDCLFCFRNQFFCDQCSNSECCSAGFTVFVLFQKSIFCDQCSNSECCSAVFVLFHFRNQFFMINAHTLNVVLFCFKAVFGRGD
ncbi:hypothetical protein S245_000118 [Arachis hypogaea]